LKNKLTGPFLESADPVSSIFSKSALEIPRNMDKSTFIVWLPKITVEDVIATPDIMCSWTHFETLYTLEEDNKKYDCRLALTPFSGHVEASHEKLMEDLIRKLINAHTSLTCYASPGFREGLIEEAANRERFEKLIRGEYAKMKIWVVQKRMLEAEVALRLKYDTSTSATQIMLFYRHYGHDTETPLARNLSWTLAPQPSRSLNVDMDDEWCANATIMRLRWTIDNLNGSEPPGSAAEEKKFKRNWRLSKFADQVHLAIKKKRQELDSYEEEEHEMDEETLELINITAWNFLEDMLEGARAKLDAENASTPSLQDMPLSLVPKYS
jgi:hypothetical protein